MKHQDEAAPHQPPATGLFYAAVLILAATITFLTTGLLTGVWLLSVIAAAGGGLSLSLFLHAIVIARRSQHESHPDKVR